MLRWHLRGRADRKSTRGRNNSDISDGGQQFTRALKPELLDAWLTAGGLHENSMRWPLHDAALERSSGQGEDVNVYGEHVSTKLRFVTRWPLTA